MLVRQREPDRRRLDGPEDGHDVRHAEIVAAGIARRRRRPDIAGECQAMPPARRRRRARIRTMRRPVCQPAGQSCEDWSRRDSPSGSRMISPNARRPVVVARRSRPSGVRGGRPGGGARDRPAWAASRRRATRWASRPHANERPCVSRSISASRLDGHRAPAWDATARPIGHPIGEERIRSSAGAALACTGSACDGFQSPSVRRGDPRRGGTGTPNPSRAAVALGQCAPSSERNQIPRVPSGAVT